MPFFDSNKPVAYLPFALLWLLVSMFMAMIYFDPRVPLAPQLYSTFALTTLSVPASWYAAIRLVPRYLYQKQVSGFIWRITLLVFINVVALYLAGATLYHFLSGRPVMPEVNSFLTIFLVLLFVNLIFISIACAVKIIADRYGLEERLHETEKEKITAELSFLRSQINPHFLFNLLNSIYFQIDKSNQAARGSVERFSEMLRYQLYDCNTDKIEIKKEVDYIKSYVAMQSQRLEAGTDIQLATSGDLEGFTIAPFMILTLVENAFKHVSHFKNPADNRIHIDIKKNENMLVVKATNTYDETEKVEHLLQSGGLGLLNLKRRLELLYPDKAQLLSNNTDIIFESILNLQLS